MDLNFFRCILLIVVGAACTMAHVVKGELYMSGLSFHHVDSRGLTLLIQYGSQWPYPQSHCIGNWFPLFNRQLVCISLCMFVCIHVCVSAHTSMCLGTDWGICMWKSEANIRSHLGLFIHIIHWDRESQSNPELTDVASLASQITLQWDQIPCLHDYSGIEGEQSHPLGIIHSQRIWTLVHTCMRQVF